MSEYSLDSLENINEYSLEKSTSARNDNDDVTETNEIQRNVNRCTKTIAAKNSIIASGGFVRRQKCHATQDEEQWLYVRRRNTVLRRPQVEEGDGNHSISTTMMQRREMQTSSLPKCSIRNGTNVGLATMKADKKLGNVLAPWTNSRSSVKRTFSYSELYRRRYNTLTYPHIRSPEGSTLSICGDSQFKELSLDDEGNMSPFHTSMDNNSEFSFYRRFIEGTSEGLATRTTRSCEISRQSTNITFPEEQCEQSVSKSKLRKPSYRPYTIEEYKSLSVPTLDRSLGPDKNEIQVKREWLMRRRSYGDMVSTHNRERILYRERRLKSRRAVARKCFLPPLKDRDSTGSKQDRGNSRISETNSVTQEISPSFSVTRPKKIPNEKLSSGAVETVDKTLPNNACFSSSLVSYTVLEDQYLETLQKRHLQEKELVDRFMRQALSN